MPKGGLRPGAGAPRGPRKAKVEAIERERIMQQLDAPASPETVAAATTGESRVPEATGAVQVLRPRRLAKERLEDLLELFIGAAAYYQPSMNPAAQPNPNESWDEFAKWGKLAMDCGKEAAKYQSPQFRAIVVAPAPDSNQPEKRKRFTLTIFEAPPRALEPPAATPTSDRQH